MNQTPTKTPPTIQPRHWKIWDDYRLIKSHKMNWVGRGVPIQLSLFLHMNQTQIKISPSVQHWTSQESTNLNALLLYALFADAHQDNKSKKRIALNPHKYIHYTWKSIQKCPAAMRYNQSHQKLQASLVFPRIWVHTHRFHPPTSPSIPLNPMRTSGSHHSDCRPRIRTSYNLRDNLQAQRKRNNCQKEFWWRKCICWKIQNKWNTILKLLWWVCLHGMRISQVFLFW